MAKSSIVMGKGDLNEMKNNIKEKDHIINGLNRDNERINTELIQQMQNTENLKKKAKVEVDDLKKKIK